MFERYSEESIKAIMMAQEIARALRMAQIGPEALLHGIIEAGSPAVVDAFSRHGLTAKSLKASLSPMAGTMAIKLLSIPYAPSVEDAFRRAQTIAVADGSQSVEPEHILYCLKDFPEMRHLSDVTGISIQSCIESVFSARLAPSTRGFGTTSEPTTATPEATEQSPKKKTTIGDWFTADTIRVIALAEEHASADGSDTVGAEHLLNALIEQGDSIPPQVVAPLSRVGQSEQSQPSRSKSGVSDVDLSEVSFSPEVSTILVAAHSEARKSCSESIAPQQLMLGIFKSFANGTISGAGIESPAQLYDRAKDMVRQIAAMSTEKGDESPVAPLMADEHIVRATKRLLDTLNAAYTEALSQNRTANVGDLILALLDEARKSEVQFVANRDQLFEIFKRVKDSGAAVDETASVNRIVRNAAEHAHRQQCARLDISHLGLALLDEKDGTVQQCISAFAGSDDSPETTRRVLIRRLEWCLIWQAAQNNSYQTEEGHLIDLRDIWQSFR